MTEHSPEKKITVLKHLAAGKTADMVATITKLDRYEVIDMASNHGYPAVDKMAKAVDLLVARLEKEREAEAVTNRPDLASAVAASHRPQPARPGPRAVPDVDATRAPQSLTRPDELRVLLNTAKDHPAKRIQAAADRIFDQVDRLRHLIREDQAKHAAKRAEQAAKDSARGTPAATTPAAADTDGPSAKEIRSWARLAGVGCPDVGRVPQHVRDAYHQAHPDAAAS